MNGDRVEVRIEDPGDTVEVEVIAVHVSDGASVRTGDVLFEVATDKANADIEAPHDGVIEELLVAEGDIVPVSQLLAVLRT
jgi:pyruvate/2-oxoglutarate dehydrogenase complex dihydrolipoamide acyltransferase (E2) component